MAEPSPIDPASETDRSESELAQIERGARHDLARASSKLWLSRLLGLGVGALLISWALVGPQLSDRALLIIGLLIAVSATVLGFVIAISSRRRQVQTVERYTGRLRDLAQQLQAEIRDRKAAEEKLREQVRRDALTGVLNHAAFLDELRTRCSSSERAFTVAMVDVDRMKFINDSYGHAIGDTVLTTVAQALRRDGAIVGRYGGDEFSVIVPFDNLKEAEAYRQAVAQNLMRSGVVDQETGAPLPIVASVGLAMWPRQGTSPPEIINAADADMYAWKRRQDHGLKEEDRALLLDEEAARTIGELVPLLTSKIAIPEKLSLAAQRLATAAGYDSVNFTVFDPEIGKPVQSTITFSTSGSELVEAWQRETSRETPDAHPIRALLERTRRPLILVDPAADPRLTEGERAIIQAAGLQTILIVPMIWEGEVLGMVAAASKRERAFTPRDSQFLSTVAAQITALARMAVMLEEPEAKKQTRARRPRRARAA